MMKLDCEVIRDLLPLYAEHIASPASTALVEEHLESCEACREELRQMQMPVPVQPEPQPDAPLKGIRKTLQKKSIRTVAAAVLAVLCAVALVFWMGTARAPATAEQAQFWTYNRKEDGANLCILEAQGEGVWLEVEGGFSWGMENITVTAMHLPLPRRAPGTAGAGGVRGVVCQRHRLPHPGADRGLRRRDPLLQ